MPNLNFVPLAILEQSAFNDENIRGSHDHGHARFTLFLRSGVGCRKETLFEA